MVTDWKTIKVPIGLLVFCVAGCVSSPESDVVKNSMPEEWSGVFPDDSNVCVSIVGDYQTLGEGNFGQGGSLTEMRLDAALGHTFPAEGIPSRVGFTVEKGRKNSLNIQFGPPVNLVYSEPFKCFNGWHVFEQRRTNQYVGDGTNLDYSIRKVELGKGNDGSLIVHVILQGQFSSLSVLKSRELTETWSKYEVFDH